MTRQALIQIADERLKIVRSEYNLTQDKMAHVLGLSKKTVVEIEKSRSSLGWTGTVALLSVFADSEVLGAACGGPTGELIAALAFEAVPLRPVRTLGGKIWWRVVRTEDGWRIQQNLISQHYRLLDPADNRLCASFDLAQVEAVLRDCRARG